MSVRARSAPQRADARSSALPREVRIIGGAWKRSKLPVADRPGLRPTPDRVRETVFNWLGQSLDGWRCVDAFAGSGALGFEAASRSTRTTSAALVASLNAVRQRLGAQNVRVERGDAVQWLARAAARSVDLVFLDPPFDSDLLAPALAAAAPIVGDGGLVYVEAPAPVDADAAAALGFAPHRDARAGAVHYQLLRRSALG